MSTFTSLISRLLFGIAFVLAAVAVVEKAANVAGYTLLRASYDPSRLLELAAVALMFVVALQLRDIRRAVQSVR
jgi:hypothetical protein